MSPQASPWILLVGANESKKQIAPLAKGGDGGDSGGMDRIGRLESDVEYIKRDIADLKTNVHKIQDDIGSKGGIREILAELSAKVVTKSDVAPITSDISGIKGGLDKFATKADLVSMGTQIGDLGGQIKSLPSTTKILGLITLAVVVGGLIFGAAHYWGVVITLPQKP
ncbi:hypothetical protein [Labrys neptuniae]